MRKNLVLLLLFVVSFGVKAQNTVSINMVGLNDIGTKIGLSYEKNISSNQKWSVILPLDYVFMQYEQHKFDKHVPFFTFSPGVKFYTTKSEKIFQHALGLNIHTGFGKIQNEYIIGEPSTGERNYETLENHRLGLLFTNYLSLNLSKHLILGANGSVGTMFVNKLSQPAHYNKSTLYPSLNFTLGYKF